MDHQRRYSLLVSEELPTVEESSLQQNGIPVEEKEPLPVIDDNADLLTVVRRSLGDSSAVGDISPSILPAEEKNTWSQDLIANIDRIQNSRKQQDKKKELTNGINDDIIPDATHSGNSKESVDIQAAAFADIVTAHVQSLQPTEEAPTSSPSTNQQTVAPADIAIAHADSATSRSREDRNIHSLSVVLLANQKPIITTTNTVPHADAFHMGDNVPDASFQPEKNLDRSSH